MASRTGNNCLEFVGETQGLHALILTGSQIVHHQRDANFNWTSDAVLSNAATQPAAIASYFERAGRHTHYAGSVAIIVEGSNAFAYSRAAFSNDWARGERISTSVSGPPCLINVGLSSMIALLQEGSDIVHYGGGAGEDWHRQSVVCGSASGQATGLVSQFRASTDNADNVEVLIPQGNKLTHFWQNNSAAGSPWVPGVVVDANASGAGCMISSVFRSDGDAPFNFEVLVPEGNNLVHYWRDNSNSALPWTRGVTVATDVSGPASMVAGSFGNGNFEALVQEGSSVFHWWRDNTSAGMPWNKDVLVAG